MFDEIVNAGNDMARAVNDAVSSGDFSHLNDDLRDSAQRMSDTLKQEGQQAVRTMPQNRRLRALQIARKAAFPQLPMWT